MNRSVIATLDLVVEDFVEVVPFNGVIAEERTWQTPRARAWHNVHPTW